jgi:hypothetical protein
MFKSPHTQLDRSRDCFQSSLPTPTPTSPPPRLFLPTPFRFPLIPRQSSFPSLSPRTTYLPPPPPHTECLHPLRATATIYQCLPSIILLMPLLQGHLTSPVFSTLPIPLQVASTLHQLTLLINSAFTLTTLAIFTTQTTVTSPS